MLCELRDAGHEIALHSSLNAFDRPARYKLEKEKSNLDEKFSSGEQNFDELAKWNKRYKEIEDTLALKMETIRVGGRRD